MSRLLVRNFSISLDGFGAGPTQTLDNPLGVGGGGLHNWIFATRSGRTMIGLEGGDEGVDNEYFSNRDENIGATIMGRNMFGPIRGDWDDEWTGWWGDEPPFHHRVFVLTNHARADLVMEGGTTFHFVNDGIEAAREAALDAAGGKDVLIGGGVSTIRQYWTAGLIDELLLTSVPVLLGRGERLFEGLGDVEEHYQIVERVASSAVTHVRIAKST